jgi:TPR repeat protein
MERIHTPLENKNLISRLSTTRETRKKKSLREKTLGTTLKTLKYGTLGSFFAIAIGFIMWPSFKRKQHAVKRDIIETFEGHTKKIDTIYSMNDAETTTILNLMAGKADDKSLNALLKRYGYTEEISRNAIAQFDPALYSMIWYFHEKYGAPNVSLKHGFINPLTWEEEYDRAMFEGVSNTIFLHHIHEDPLIFTLPDAAYNVWINTVAINPVGDYQAFIKKSKEDRELRRTQTTRSHQEQWAIDRQRYLLNKWIAELAHSRQQQEQWAIRLGINVLEDELRVCNKRQWYNATTLKELKATYKLAYKKADSLRTLYTLSPHDIERITRDTALIHEKIDAWRKDTTNAPLYDALAVNALKKLDALQKKKVDSLSATPSFYAATLKRLRADSTKISNRLEILRDDTAHNTSTLYMNHNALYDKSSSYEYEAHRLYEPQMVQEAIEYYTKHAKIKDPHIMYQIGIFYSHYFDAYSDLDRWEAWFKKAAMTGEKNIAYRVWRHYENLYRLYDSSIAPKMLGNTYLDTAAQEARREKSYTDRQKLLQDAISYYIAAARSGSKEAKHNLIIIYETLAPNKERALYRKQQMSN